MMDISKANEHMITAPYSVLQWFNYKNGRKLQPRCCQN